MEEQQLNLLIITHKDCMDGLGSDLVLRLAHNGWKIDTVFVQYKGEKVITEHLAKTELAYHKIVCADFTPPLEYLEELYKACNDIEIYDHHEDKESIMKAFEEKYENSVYQVFDINKSGAEIVYDMYRDGLFYKLSSRAYDNLKILIRLIADRDLWKWEIPNSREMNAAIATLTNKEDTSVLIDLVNEYDTDELNIFLVTTGGPLILDYENTISKKAKEAYLIDIESVPRKFVCVNSTTLTSEIGNALCTKYNSPAMVYFIKEVAGKQMAVCSLRSLNTLPSVNHVAHQFGGGGHRNAAGMTMSLEELVKVLNTATKV